MFKIFQKLFQRFFWNAIFGLEMCEVLEIKEKNVRVLKLKLFKGVIKS